MSKTSTAFPPSPYSSAGARSAIETHTLSVLVDNEPGVLARVVGMFSGRGYNIESLTVAEVAHETHLSRITIVTSGTPEIIEQIRHQLERLVPVHSVKDLTLTVRAIERELAMIKVRGKGENRVEAMNLAEAFRAKVIDATVESFIFELTGAPSKIDDFVALMRPLGLVEVSRTGVAAISRGPEPISSRLIRKLRRSRSVGPRGVKLRVGSPWPACGETSQEQGTALVVSLDEIRPTFLASSKASATFESAVVRRAFRVASTFPIGWPAIFSTFMIDS